LCHGSIARRYEPRKQIGKDGLHDPRQAQLGGYRRPVAVRRECRQTRPCIAHLILSSLLGALNLSRAVSDPSLSREILDKVRQQLVDLTAVNAFSKRGAGWKQQEPNQSTS
jgi:hypothetical protein